MYLLTFFSSSLFVYLSEKKKHKIEQFIYLAIAFFIPSLLAGVRDYSVGNDVLLYGNYWFEKAVSYNSLVEYLTKANEYGIGVGYAFVNYIASRISSSPHFFYFAYELLLLIILYVGLKPYKKDLNIAYAFLLFFFCYYNSSLNILRQMGAIVLVLYSYQFVVNKKIWKFLMVVAVAFTFHSSALVALVVYPCYIAINSKLKNIFKILIVGGSVMAVFGVENIFNLLGSLNIVSLARYQHYFSDTDVGGRFLRIIYWGIVVALVWISKNKFFMIEKGKYAIFACMTYFSLILSILSFVVSTWAIRIAFFFDIGQIITIPLMGKCFSFKMGRQKITGIILMLIPIIYWLITFIVRNGGETFPYVFMQN